MSDFFTEDQLESQLNVCQGGSFTDFCLSARLIGGSLWGLFSVRPLEEQLPGVLKLDDGSSRLRRVLAEATREITGETLAELMEAETRASLSRLDADFLVQLVRKSGKSHHTNVFVRIGICAARASGFEPSLAKAFLSAERETSDLEALAERFEAENDEAAAGLRARLVGGWLERLAQAGRITEFCAILKRRSKDLRAVGPTELQKTLYKLFFSVLQTGVARQLPEPSLRAAVEEFAQAGLEFSPFVLNRAVDLAARHTEAAEFDAFLLEKIKEKGVTPNLVTFNTLMDNRCLRGQLSEALKIFDSLGDLGLQPDNFSFSILVKGLKNISDCATLESFLERNPNIFASSDVVVFNGIIDAYSSLGEYTKADSIYHRMTDESGVSPDQVTFNILIKGSCKSRDFSSALRYFEDMKKLGLKPNRITYNSLMDLAVKIQEMARALFFVEQMQEDEITPDGFTYSILLNGLKINNSARPLVEASLKNVLGVIESGEIKLDEIFFNSILDVCAKYELNDQLRFFYDLMKSKRVPESSVTFGIMIKFYGKVGDFDSARAAFEKMTQNNLPVNDVTYGSILDACAKTGNMQVALKIFESLKDSRMNMNSIVFTTIMKGLLKEEKFEEALSFFEKIKGFKSVTGMLITFNCALDGWVRKGDLNAAIKLFREIEESFGADLVSYSTIIKGFCGASRKTEAFELLQKMFESGVESDISVVNLFLDSCATQQDFNFAIKAYQYFMTKRISPNEITFGVMIKVYGFAHEVGKAFELLDLMTAFKINPSIVIYTNLVHISFYNKNPKRAEAAFNLFKKTGGKGDRLLYSKLIDGLIKFSDISRVLKFVEEAIKDSCSLKPETMARLRELSNNNEDLSRKLDQLASLETTNYSHWSSTTKDRFKNNYTQENTKKFKAIIREEQARNNSAAKHPKNNHVKDTEVRREPEPVRQIAPSVKEEQKPLGLFNFRKRVAS